MHRENMDSSRWANPVNSMWQAYSPLRSPERFGTIIHNHHSEGLMSTIVRAAKVNVAKVKAAELKTFADVQHELGDIPLTRIRSHPYPATEEDVLSIHAKERRLFELVNGFLVEKAMGFRAS